MDPLPILHAFGFQTPADEPPPSIYPYAPVFRVEAGGRAWILKRGQRPLERARAVAAWARALAAEGVPVVTPADGFGENPRSFPGEDGEEQVWVVYPYIDGTPYRGSPEEIRAGGELLGCLHAFRPGAEFGLKVSPTVVEVEREEVEADVAGVLAYVERFYPQDLEAARAVLVERVERYFTSALPRLLSLELPLANCTWDYKAGNLIYRREDFPPGGPPPRPEALPVLVDADNAGRIPRLYDLAIAALLFHNDGLGPGRVLTPAEWGVFLEGYQRRVRLSRVELKVWDDLLLCAWMDEALWLLNGDEADWAHPVQGPMQRSLLLQDLGRFTLPGLGG